MVEALLTDIHWPSYLCSRTIWIAYLLSKYFHGIYNAKATCMAGLLTMVPLVGEVFWCVYLVSYVLGLIKTK